MDKSLRTLNGIINLEKAAKKIAAHPSSDIVGSFAEIQNDIRLLDRLARLNGTIQGKKEGTAAGDIIAFIFDYTIGATFYDFILYNKILTAIANKEELFWNIFKAVGELDMAQAIASVRASLPHYCTPEFSENKEIMMDSVYHPIIDEPVANSLMLNKNCLITGSNASGKSTFIKAVGINTVLAHSINTCMAVQMRLPHLLLLSSMAVRDDLNAGESYYIKEIKYLNRIIQNLSEERLILCIVDEILRGTNMQERIAASTAVLKYLDKKNCIAVVASHDIELTKLLEASYEAYHFREQINDKDISFEYKIHSGPAVSKNAIRLLEYVNFPREIVEEAKCLAADLV